MICILLAAGHSRKLEYELKNDPRGRYSDLIGFPKALLPGGGVTSAHGEAADEGGKRIVDYWWDLLKNARQLFSQVYLVTNADKFKHYERWATASDFPVDNIVNDGTTSHEDRLGSVADLELCLRAKKISGKEVMVIAGDMIFQDERFDLTQLVRYLRSKPDGDLAMYYELRSAENACDRGIVDVCPFTGRITRFLEKPSESELATLTKSRNASVVFYVFRPDSLSYVGKYLSHLNASGGDGGSADERSMGKFFAWYLHKEARTVYGMKIPTGFGLIGQTSLADYEQFLAIRNERKNGNGNGNGNGTKRITRRAYARVGLMGNPSDGFYGKTISLSIKNFWAEVTIWESAKLTLIPHPICDPTEFGSLADLHGISDKEGYLGGLRLLQATCKKFYHYCSSHGVALAKRNFTLRYDTNIPRQVGLAGSSALVTATLRCLMDFFRVTSSDLPKERMPQFILDVEVAELNIQAGLQDRVVQVYEGLVSMDFSKKLMGGRGYGNYRNLPLENLPPLFLAYQSDPSDSGRIHSDVRLRFDSGEQEVVEAMSRFAHLTEQAEDAVAGRDTGRLADLMEQNFALRREVYGDACLGAQNLRMVEIGAKFGAACKFPGSGGAIVGLLKDQTRYAEMKSAYEEEGFVVTKVLPNAASS